MALIDNQLLHSVLKGFVSVFTEMYLDGVSGVLQFSLETVGLLLIFGFCHIFSTLHKNRVHRLVSVRFDAALYYLFSCD